MVVKKNDDMYDETVEEDNYNEFYDEAIEEEKDPYQVEEGDFTNKEGNYIFTVGNVSSGKSTLQNFLIRRLWSKSDINLEYGHTTNDHQQEAILNNWVKSGKKGILPPRTKQGVIQEFNLTISQKRKKRLDVSLIEISGEDIISIIPSLDSAKKPSVHKHLDRYLTANNKINKRFVFVSDGEKHTKGVRTNVDGISEDILFSTFLRYLLSDTQKGLKDINVLFVIAKWDTIKEDYKNNDTKYMHDNFPNTLSILDSERVTSMLLPFSVGKIEETLTDKEHEYENRIVVEDTTYVDRLIQWVYNTFTGETLTNFPPIKPNFMYRVAKLFGIR